MQFDPLNDALIKMYNAEQAGKFDVELAPASKLLGNVLEIMQKSGYVGSIERQENGRGGTYRVELRGAIIAVVQLNHVTAFVAKNTTNGKLAICLLKTLDF